MPSRKKKSPEDGLQIESTMKSIEKLLEKLENPDTPLNESMAHFEEGIGLIRQAQEMLAAAEQKIELLLEEDGEPVVSEFDDDEDIE